MTDGYLRFPGASLLMAAGLVNKVLQLERHNALADRCNPCIYLLVLSLVVVARMMMWPGVPVCGSCATEMRLFKQPNEDPLPVPSSCCNEQRHPSGGWDCELGILGRWTALGSSHVFLLCHVCLPLMMFLWKQHEAMQCHHHC